MRASNTSGLGYLMGCYFHQDWVCDADSWQDVIAEFVSEEPRLGLLAEAMGESSLVLATSLVDDDPKYLYDVFICEFVTRGESTMRAWLTAVRNRIADQSYDSGRVPSTALDDVIAGLRRLEIERPTNGAVDWRPVAEQFGESAPVEEVTALLGAMSFVLAPAAPSEPGLKIWLDEVRTAIAIPAAARWPPTSHGGDSE